MSDGLLDTSIFVARESGRPLGEVPTDVAISVVTVGELTLGVLAASDDAERSARAATLDNVRTWDPLAITEAVMTSWARLIIDCRQAGSMLRAVKLTDALIAATAVTHGIPVVTQDDDFAVIAAAHPPLSVIRV